MIIRHTARTDIGNWREKNEDAYLVNVNMGLYAVADGMGGHIGGGLASQLSLKGLQDALPRIVQEAQAPKPENDSTQKLPFLQRITRAFGNSEPADPRAEILRRAFEEANRSVVQYSKENPKYKGMGTTLTGVWIETDANNPSPHAYVGNIGDSRTYLVRDGELRQVTEDHSWVQEQVREGKLSSQEAEFHYLKNVVTRCIGLDDQVEVDVFPNDLREGDRYLLCSDGLTNMLRGDEILETFQSPELDTIAEDLVERSKMVGGLDNITVVIVEVFRF